MRKSPLLHKVVRRCLRPFGLRSLPTGWPVQEHDVYAAIRAVMPAGQSLHIVDGGAHHGETSVRLARMFPGSTIHCFEPNPTAFARLQAAVGGEASHIKAYQLALDERPGELDF